MRRNIILSVIIIIVLLAVFASIFIFLDKKFGIIKPKKEAAEESVKPKPTPMPTPVPKEEAIPAKEANYPLNLAKKSGKAEECLKIEEERYRNTCLLLLAEYLKSEEVCANIVDEKLKAECADRAICEKARAENKIELCVEVKNAGLKHSCVVNIIGQRSGAKESDCDVLPNGEKKECLNYFVMANDTEIFKTAKSEQDCNSIVSESLKIWCLGKF